MNINPLLALDFYKTDHVRQYPKGLTKIVSNMTPRKSRIQDIDYVIWFGLQYYIKEFLMKKWNSFFTSPEYYINQYLEIIRTSVNPDYDAPFLYELAELGYLPLRIRSIQEGSKVPMRTPCMTIENTHPNFAWLPNFLETQISDEIWQSTTSATIAHQYYLTFLHYAKMQGADENFVKWQGHDFSMRGMASVEAAAKSGAGHLLSFNGTDTVPSIQFLKRYYGASGFVGGSVPATEHSVMCAGSKESEFDTFKRLITEVYPKGIVSIVSDTWDFWNVIQDFLPRLKNLILAREGKVVIRPDSGDPVHILCGNPAAPIGSVEHLGLVEALWNIFGGTTTSKGFKVLNSHIGAIYGDSITLERQKQILERLHAKNFASTNVVLGIGSYTYQYTTRDTFGWAIKATYAEIDGKPLNLFKAPKTDDGTKFSAIGLPVVTNQGDGLVTFKDQQPYSSFNDVLNDLDIVYEDGRIIADYTLLGLKTNLGT